MMRGLAHIVATTRQRALRRGVSEEAGTDRGWGGGYRAATFIVTVHQESVNEYVIAIPQCCCAHANRSANMLNGISIH